MAFYCRSLNDNIHFSLLLFLQLVPKSSFYGFFFSFFIYIENAQHAKELQGWGATIRHVFLMAVKRCSVAFLCDVQQFLLFFYFCWNVQFVIFGDFYWKRIFVRFKGKLCACVWRLCWMEFLDFYVDLDAFSLANSFVFQFKW